MALSGDQIDILADKYIMDLYTSFEDEVIADIARRVQKTGRYTETAELMAKSMREQGYSPEQIRKEVMKKLNASKEYQMFVAENTKQYKEEVQALIKQLTEQAKRAGNDLVAEAGDMAWNADLSMWEEQGVDLKKPNNMSQLLEAFKKQTAGSLRNLTKTTGFKNVNTGTVGVMSAYQREMDLAVLKVATGVFSYDQAVMDSVKRLAQSGLRTIDYANGKSYQLDTAARMVIRTGMSQLAGKVMEANLESTGQDLVITSQHMGARPDHAPWQNKVFSFSGKSKKYPDFRKETGYGTVTGLKGANCCHDFYPFFEGASVIEPDVVEPEPRTINGKEYTYYECTQQQRKLERDIRALKREVNALEALGMNTEEVQSKLSEKMAEYKDFSFSAGLKPKNNRLRVVNIGADESKKRNNVVGRKARLKETKDGDTIKLKRKIAKADSAITNLKKQFGDITEGYSFDEWFRDFKSIEEGYGRITEEDEPDVIKLKNISQKIQALLRKKAQWKTQLPVLGGQGTPFSIADALKGANPKYASGTQYAVNCQRCVQTYELRRRGYDVEALPKPKIKKDNVIIWGNECFVDSSGNTPKFAFNQSEAEIKFELANAPDGSRHIIYTAWKKGSAHVFIAEKENGIVRFVDPQTNNDDVGNYFSRGKAGKFGILRVDDKDITKDTSKLKETVRW